MPFQQQPSVTRDPHIREIEIRLLKTVDPDDPNGPQSVWFGITVDDQFDQPMNHLHGDLVPHAPPAVVQVLQDLMDWAWHKAEAEVIP